MKRSVSVIKVNQNNYISKLQWADRQHESVKQDLSVW